MSMIKETTITINGDSYRVRKFPALPGAYFLKLFTEKLLPAVASINTVLLATSKIGRKKSEEKDFISINEGAQALLPILASISRDDLNQIMTDCLNLCDKMLPAGPQPVMIGKEFGIPDLEFDVVSCLMLCFHVIYFNVQGFFGEGGSLFSPDTIKRMLQFAPQTSTAGPGRQ